MVTINILGDCVSRDILTPLIKNNQAEVLQYHAFSNPAALFSKTGKHNISVVDFNTDDSNFRKRCAMHDINKTVFDFVFSKESEYLIFDILDARLPILQKDGHYITVSNCIRNASSTLDAKFEISSYKSLSPFDDITIDEWENIIIKLCNIIKEHYKPEQVILNKHFGVNNYLCNDEIIPYNKHLSFIKQFNTLTKQLFKIAEHNLTGCHIIDFPNHVIGEKNHPWGLYPLHYHSLYYEYGYKAISVCISKLNKDTEQKQLLELKSEYSDKFLLLPSYHRIASLNTQIDKLEKNIEELNNKLMLNYEVINSQSKNIDLLTRDLNKCRTDLKSISNSRSYKLGRFITYVPRKIKKIYKNRPHST